MTEASSIPSSFDCTRTSRTRRQQHEAVVVDGGGEREYVTKNMYFMGIEFDRRHVPIFGRSVVRFDSRHTHRATTKRKTESRIRRLSLAPHHFCLLKWKMILRSNLSSGNVSIYWCKVFRRDMGRLSRKMPVFSSSFHSSAASYSRRLSATFHQFLFRRTSHSTKAKTEKQKKKKN